MREAKMYAIQGASDATWSIECPYCRDPLESAVTLGELRAKRGIGPGSVVEGDYGDTYRLPRNFPAKPLR